MDDIGKQEGKNMEEGLDIKGPNQTHDHEELEGVQEPNPNSVDGVIVEMQKLTGDSGVEMPTDIVGPVDLAPAVLETLEDAGVGTDPNNEPHANTESDKLVANVDSDMHRENEVPVKVESDNLVSNVDSDVQCESEVCLKIEIGENGEEKGEELKDVKVSEAIPSFELDASAETNDLDDNGDGGSHHTVQTKVPMEIEEVDNDGEEGKALEDGVSSKATPSSELCINAETDNVVSEVESDMCHDGDVAMGKPTDGVSSKATPSSELCINAETDNVVSEVESDMCHDGDVAMGKPTDGVSSKANPASELHINAETDNAVSQAESDMCHDGDVAMGKPTDGLSSKANHSSELHINAETDNAVSQVESDMCHDGDVAMGKPTDGVSSKANPSSELHINAETDNVVSQAESDMCHDGDIAMGKLTDGLSSKANPSSELHINAETDNAVSQVESDMCHDGDIAMGKLTDGLSSKANPSSELLINAETDNAVSQVESDMCHDGDVAMGKLTDGVSSKANPSSEPITSAETDRVVCKMEHDVPRDSKVAREKMVYGVSSKAKRSPNEPPSSVKADNVCKVERDMPRDNEVSMETESESDDDDEKRHALTGGMSSKTKLSLHPDIKEQVSKSKFHVGREAGMKSLDPERTFLLDPGADGDESGTEEEQAEFMKEVENFYKERHLEFKAPKFYKEELNLLKLWRAVIKLGSYEKVTSCKLWRQVGESFNPPKTCTTVSWTFRIFYEKALLEFEKHRWHGSELALPAEPSRVEIRADGSQTCGSGRTLRDAAARAMQGWHSQRLFGNGEDKHLSTMPKSDKQLKSSGLLKRKKLSPGDCAAQVTDMKGIKPRLDMTVFDVGPPADWVKINVKRFNDCFEVYALVPGLLREEVHVQSDPVGRLVISGQPMQLDNPWGVTPFKKVVSLPSRIDPHQTSAVVTLNGQLFVRVPLEQSDY